MKIGIVGLPNVGKSTLFNTLTKNNVLAANYPFATIEPNVGMVPVPDPRLAKLAELYGAKKTIPATVSFVDIAGIVRGASEGEGLGNKFLANIRECNAIVQVVRAFDDSDVTHVDGSADPARDIETINTELILADLQSLEKRQQRLAGEMKSNPKVVGPIKATVDMVAKALDEGKLASQLGLSDDQLEHIRDLQLLTAKPFIFVFNVNESDLSNDAKHQELAALVPGLPVILVCAKVEAELMELPEDEAAELLAELGQKQSGLEQLIGEGYKVLGLQSYLTAGPKEVRAWTITAGATAPQAAGVIHTDFEKGFIRAEVVGYQDLVAAGSLAAARAAGKARLEGKDYIMRPDDVVEFRFNV
ncbi:redox-regulated ATPase YchF [Patescibacteria group bacterium]|nr:MAG: redox-regulated ATPase YchF [Patescibacteria group bacterium]